MSEKIVVVGGGLAGLSAAARLAFLGYRVTLIEKAPKLGGRAITIPIKGFNFNFGAHAIYGRDRSILKKYEHELGLKVDWKDFSAKKAHYDLGSFTTPMPATLEGLLKTKILDHENKLRFTYEVIKTLTSIERGEDGIPIGEYLQGKEADQVRDMLLTLASSNFFSNEPEKIPSTLFFRYYKRLFSTRKPVAYIGGGWQSIVDGLEAILMRHGGEVIHDEVARDVADEKIAIIEQVYDKHFPGWREQLAAKRVSKRATVQEIKCIDDQRLMPVKFHSIQNAYFAGDWCEGEGQLSELSFSSAYHVTEKIIRGV